MDEGGSHVEGPMTLVLRAIVERSGSVVEVLKGPPLGEFVLFDRAYMDFASLHDRSGRGVHWVTRANSSLTLSHSPGKFFPPSIEWL
jgi:hypothetical protein